MAYDKIVDSAFLEAGLTLVGDSIRAKGGTSAKLEFPNGMKAAVDAIDTSEDLDEPLNEQESLIDQIQSALEGKAAASVETATLTFVSDASKQNVNFCYVNAEGEVVTSYYPNYIKTDFTDTIVVPSILYAEYYLSITGAIERPGTPPVFIVYGDVTITAQVGGGS